MTKLSDAELSKRSLALAAASQASEALAELLRYAREGDNLQGVFGEEVVELLLDAAKLAIEVEENESHSDIYGHLRSELEFWANG